MELKIHTTIEEEILYPAVREALPKEADLLDEANVEHDSAKELILQIESGTPGEDLWDAKVTVLGEYIKHHVKEEQTEMFPKVRKTKLDLRALGEQLAAFALTDLGSQALAGLQIADRSNRTTRRWTRDQSREL